MLLNCDVGEDSWEFLGLQGDQINPEYSLEGQMLKLKLQYFDHLIQRTDSLKKTLMLGKIEGKRRGWQRMRWLDGIFDSMDISLCKLNSGWDGWMASSTWWRWVLPSSRSWWWPGKPGVLQSMGLQRVGHDWATELNWTFRIQFLEDFPVVLWLSQPLKWFMGKALSSCLPIQSHKMFTPNQLLMAPSCLYTDFKYCSSVFKALINWLPLNPYSSKELFLFHHVCFPTAPAPSTPNAHIYLLFISAAQL